MSPWSHTSRDAGTLELLDLGAPGFAGQPAGTGTPARGVFLLSFHAPVHEALGRLAAVGLGGVPRVLSGPGQQLTATVVDPDGVTVELLNHPMTQL
ncbi:MAG: hypothetical protein JWR32_1099 [Mycobacterium sp.]|jgi:hypothetical protein|nr:hypothetical protein [Mycobacterium sp.]